MTHKSRNNINMVIFFSLLFFTMMGQSKPEVTLDFSIPENDSHPYAVYFKKQDQDYHQWLYAINRVNERDYWLTHGPKRLLQHSGGNSSLIFTLKHPDGTVELDTVRNSLHQEDYVKPRDFLGLRKFFASFRAKRIANNIQIEGELPEGCISFVSMDRHGLKCGVQLSENQSRVNIILLKEGEIVRTLVDDLLQKGWNNFEWKRGNDKQGKYTLSITVDDHTMSQIVKL